MRVETAPPLREVTGPSALGEDLSRLWMLLKTMAVSDFRTRYANTLLGYLWTVLRPLIFFGVIFLVLREVIGFGRDVTNYGALLILGLVLFQYFSDATSAAVRSLRAKEPLLRKMSFGAVVVPVSVSVTAAFTLLLNLATVLPLIVIAGVEPQLSWLLLIPLLAVLIVFTTCLSMLLSVAFVRSEDTGQAWGLASRLLFYASPILFPIEEVPASFQAVVAANPLAPILEQARVWVVDPAAPNGADEVGVLLGLALPITLMAAISVVGVWAFARDAPRIAETL